MSDILSPVVDAIDAQVRRHIFAQPAAMAFALSSYADAEASGEGQVFERALLHVQDERLRRMIRRHRDDETRHAFMLENRREALGLAAVPVPEHLKLIDILSRAAGGLLDLPMGQDEHVAQVYALLYVVEERALDEFARVAENLDRVGDAVTAQLFRDIGKDEERHLRYCEAIGRRYLGDAFASRIEELRAIEQRVYGAQTRAWMGHMLDSCFLSLPLWLDATLRTLNVVGGALSLKAPAPVRGVPVAAALAAA